MIQHMLKSWWRAKGCIMLSEILESSLMAMCLWLTMSAMSAACAFSISASFYLSVSGYFTHSGLCVRTQQAGLLNCSQGSYRSWKVLEL